MRCLATLFWELYQLLEGLQNLPCMHRATISLFATEGIHCGKIKKLKKEIEKEKVLHLRCETAVLLYKIASKEQIYHFILHMIITVGVLNLSIILQLSCKSESQSIGLKSTCGTGTSKECFIQTVGTTCYKISFKNCTLLPNVTNNSSQCLLLRE